MRIQKSLKSLSDEKAEITGRLMGSEIIMEVVERQFLIGVRSNVAGIVVPLDYMTDLLKRLSNFLGESSCASVLFHIGKEAGEISFNRLRSKARKLKMDRETKQSLLEYVYFKNLTWPLVEAFELDRKIRRGRVLLNTFVESGLTKPPETPLISYYIKGYIQTFFGNLLNSEVKIIRERYINRERRQLFEISFTF